jgi:hypothetical protein
LEVNEDIEKALADLIRLLQGMEILELQINVTALLLDTICTLLNSRELSLKSLRINTQLADNDDFVIFRDVLKRWTLVMKVFLFVLLFIGFSRY